MLTSQLWQYVSPSGVGKCLLDDHTRENDVTVQYAMSNICPALQTNKSENTSESSTPDSICCLQTISHRDVVPFVDYFIHPPNLKPAHGHT